MFFPHILQTARIYRKANLLKYLAGSLQSGFTASASGVRYKLLMLRYTVMEVMMYLLYFLLWLIFNGSFTLEIGMIGLVIAGVLLAFTCKFMDYSMGKELQVYRKVFLFLKYICLLVKEIVKANMNVIHMILTQKEEVEPVLVSFHSDLKTAVGKAFLANCITLTPGTITVTLEDSDYTVHCLDETMAEGIHESEFIEYIKQLEENKPKK